MSLCRSVLGERQSKDVKGKGKQIDDPGDFEASISSLIKKTDDRWDLGKIEVDKFGNVLSTSNFHELEDLCTTKRMPPLAPDTVRRMLGSEKVFTDESDVDTVAGIYENFFTDISSSATELW